MNDKPQSTTAKLQRLIVGLSDQENKKGSKFYYDNGEIYPDDMAEIALPSILCLAQHLSNQLGMGELGYRFKIGEPNPIFPLIVEEENPSEFMVIAPYVTEIFLKEVLHHRNDLAVLYEAAAMIVSSGYSLEANTDYHNRKRDTVKELLSPKILDVP